MLRRLLSYLASRFPVQRVVSASDYASILHSLDSCEQSLNGLSASIVDLNKRLGALEIQMRRVNETSGFMPLVKGSVRLER